MRGCVHAGGRRPKRTSLHPSGEGSWPCRRRPARRRVVRIPARLGGHLIDNYPEARAQFLAARAGFEEQGASFGAYACTVWLADVSRLEGHWRAALGSYREALDRIRTHHFTVHGVDFLEGLALSAAALSRLDASARLFAAAATWFDTHGAEIRTSL